MARAVRRALAAAGIAALALTASVPTSSASIAPSFAGSTVASVQPTNGQVVGVAQPIVVTFTGPVPDRAAAERSISVTSPANVTGRFEWLDDTVVQFVPDHYWPGHSEITMMAGGIPRTFGTGATVLGVASISAHTFTVSIDGQVVRQMPASMGKPKHPTPIGSFNVLEKDKSVVMDSRTIGIPLNDPEGSPTPCVSPGAESSSIRRRGRWAPRATPTSATAASTSARTTPPGTSTRSTSVTRSSSTAR